MKKLFFVITIALVASAQFGFGQVNSNGTNSLLVSELKALNEYLHTLAIPDFKNIEVKNGYIYVMYEGGLFEKASVGDIQNVEVDKNSNTIYLNCASNSSCVYSTTEKKYYNSITISVNLQEDLSEAEATFEDFLIALVVDEIQPGASLIVKADTAIKPTTAVTTTTTSKPTTTASKTTTTPQTSSEYKINYGEKLVYPKESLDKLKAPYEATTEKNKQIQQQYIQNSGKPGSGNNRLQQVLSELNAYAVKYKIYREITVHDNYLWCTDMEYKAIRAKIEDLKTVTISSKFGAVLIECKKYNSACEYNPFSKTDFNCHNSIAFSTFFGADKNKLKELLDNFMAALMPTTINTPIKPKEINASFSYQLTTLNGKPDATYEATPITITVTGMQLRVNKYGSFTINAFKQNNDGSFGYGLSGSNTFVEFQITSDNSRAVLYTAGGKRSVQFSKQPFKLDNDTSKLHTQTLSGFGNTSTNNNLSLLKQTQGLTLYKDSVSNKYGFKGLFDKVIVEPKYDEATKFADGMARVKLNGKWGYLDATGKEIIPPKYEQANDFAGGKAKVTLNGKSFYIDKTGKAIE